MKRNKILLFSTLLFAALALLNACKKDDDTSSSAAITDEELYDLAKSTSGFVWYKNSDDFLDKSTGTGHTPPLLRTRYNAKAATALDSNGKVKAGTTFPDGSLIVKELNDNPTTLAIYAVMYKSADDPNADANGWVWAYLNANGSVLASSTGKGNGCNGCHGQADHIDFTLMNKFFQ